MVSLHPLLALLKSNLLQPEWPFKIQIWLSFSLGVQCLYTVFQLKQKSLTFKELHDLTLPTSLDSTPTSCALITQASQFIVTLLLPQSLEHTVTKNTGSRITLSKSQNWICQHTNSWQLTYRELNLSDLSLPNSTKGEMIISLCHGGFVRVKWSMCREHTAHN